MGRGPSFRSALTVRLQFFRCRCDGQHLGPFQQRHIVCVEPVNNREDGKLTQFEYTLSFVVMLVGVLFQLPSGLGNGGLFNFVQEGSSGSSNTYSAGFSGNSPREATMWSD